MGKKVDKRKGAKAAFLFLFALSFVLGLLLYLWKRKLVYLFAPALLFLLCSFYIGVGKSKRKTKEQEEDEEQFVELFAFFGIYVQDGFPVYNALEMILPYAKGRVRVFLERLLKEIEEDKTLAPYLTFASSFVSLEIKEVMLAAYQMVDQGSGGVYLHQFQRLFSKLSDQKRERKERRFIESLDNLNFLPLVGGGLSMLMLMLGLLEIMGGMLSGL